MDRNKWRGLKQTGSKTEKFTTFRHSTEDKSSIAGDRIRYLIEGDDGIIWIAFDNGIGLSKFDKKTGSSANYDPFTMVKSSGVKAIRGMVLDPRNPDVLWLGTTSGLIRFDIKNEHFEKIPHPLSQIDRYGLFALDQIDEDHLLGGFFHAGLDIYDIKEKKWELVYTDPNNPVRIFDLSKKSENEFWVAARKKGLAVYNTDEKKLTFLQSDLHNQSTPFPGFTITVYSDKDRVWVGGKYGVSYSNIKKSAFSFEPMSCADTTNGQIVNISAKYDKMYALELPAGNLLEVDNRSGNEIQHSFEDKNLAFYDMLEREDVIYLNDRNRQLYFFDKQTAELTHIPTPAINERRLSLRVMKEWSKTHAILLTAYSGTWKLEYGSNKLSPLSETDDRDEWQQDMLLHDDGTIWIGGTKGMMEYSPVTNKIAPLPLNVIDSEKEKHIHSFAKGRDGVIWIGTARGLVKLEGEEETLYNVQNIDLAGNVIYEIMIDEKDQLWLKTQKGLSKVITPEMKVVNYDRSDGIDPSGSLISVGDEIFYGTYGGYFKLSEPILRESKKSPSAHLLSFQVANQDFETESVIDHTQEVQLEHQENSFSFTFSSPNYEYPKKIQYAYRLSGLEEEWVTNQNRRFASYTNLDGGKYIFEVKARTPEGDWGEVKSVTIYLASPFWETWWFYLACGVFAFGSGFLIYTLRVRAIQRMADLAEQELQIEALKNRFTELHTSPAEIAVQLSFEELNQKLNTPLTIREFEVLKLSLEGKTNTEISDTLSISVSTVKFHLRNTYSKMGVGNRKEAFQYMLNA